MEATAGRSWSLDIALAVVGIAVATLAVAVVCFACGGRVGPATLPVALGLAATVAVVADGRRGVLAVAAAGAAIVVGAVLGCAILDASYDGQWFHREAVLQLADGWNPLAGPLGPEAVADDGARMRLNGYPAGPWILGAAVYAVSGRIETASAFAVALVVAALLAAFAALRRCGLSRWAAGAVAAVAAVGPVNVVQAVNQLPDGEVASVLLILVAAGLALHATGRRDALGLLVLALVLGVDLKQSMPAFEVILLAAGWGAGLVAGATRLRVAHAAAAAGALAFGLLVIGVHPWLTNLVRYEELTYPYPQSAGSVAAGTMRGTDLLRSMVASSAHAGDYQQARALARSGGAKWPFHVGRAEIQAFRYEGVRVGGWGPLYSGVLVLGAVAWLVGGFRSRRGALAVAVLGVGILASAAIHPESEVARFVPQVWLLALLPLPLAMVAGRRARLVAWLGVAAAVTNVALVCVGYLPAAVRHGAWLETRLRAIPAGSPVDLGRFRSNRVRLVELGVDFREVEDPAWGLELYLGLQQPVIAPPRPVPGSPGDLRLAWSPVPGAVRYELEVVLPPPLGPLGGAVTAVRRTVPGAVATADLPAPAGSFSVTVAACNRLGCGVPAVDGPLSLPVPRRARPVLGSPETGSTVSPVQVLAWLPAADAAAHRLEVVGEDGAVVVDTVTAQPYFATVLPPHRSWRATVTAVGGRADGAAGEPVKFATGPLPAPVPHAEAVPPAGTVDLSWDRVAGAASYEYLVAVPGHRPTLRGCSDLPQVRLELPAPAGGATEYHAIVRACPAGATCRCGAEAGWGPWSSAAGTGTAAVTVAPGPG